MIVWAYVSNRWLYEIGSPCTANWALVNVEKLLNVLNKIGTAETLEYA